MIRKTTWIVLAIFIAALAIALLWQRNKQQQAAEATPTEGGASQSLFGIDEQITAVRLERVGDRVVELKRNDQEEWTIAWPEGLEPDSASLDSTLSQLASMTVLSALEDAPPLEDMGLTAPAYRILITLKNGKQFYAAIGKETPTGSGYYVQGSDHRLSVVSKFSLDSILGLIDNLPLKPTPTVAVETPSGEGGGQETATPIPTP
mgnify:CR=1 FL=1|jgi:hypothetical protein